MPGNFLSNLLNFGGAVNAAQSRPPSFENPAYAANPYIEQIPAIGQEYLTPYLDYGGRNAYQSSIDANRGLGIEGFNAANTRLPHVQQMASDPTAFLNMIMKGYTPSEGYKFKQGEMLKTAHNTAAAGGLAGTENDVMNRAGLVQGLLGEDMQKFLDNVFGIQGVGLKGEENRLQRIINDIESRKGTTERFNENRLNRGYNAATGLTDFLASALQQRAGTAYSGANNQNYYNQGRYNAQQNANQNMIGSGANVLNSLSAFLPFLGG